MKLLILIAFLGSLLLAAIFGTLSIVQRKDPRKLKRNLIITALSAVAFIAIFFWIGTYSGESNRSAASSSSSKAESSKAKSSQEDDDSYGESDSDDSDSEESSSTETFNAADYNTGVTYDQLARTPDDYKYKKVSFTGKVIQVIDGDDETDLRVAVDGNYDNVIFIGYDPDIMNGSRVLEEDKITFYGESKGTTSYKSTGSGNITIPAVAVVKIEDAGKAPDDYGD
ncbi:transcriptional regulator [Lacticaseibacillus paracasei]|uniref:transcriptional regulator n=1 Tax=Lacticaseibacillus paracasei TaxID=1597 RepID=UPI0025A02D3D|nr:transcriptional regulator [Lacticaseibacillus paracasei]MDM7525468.1 transcriptional regulator [Lacticaseibacillus paracasei]